jgi:hypothetical protein
MQKSKAATILMSVYLTTVDANTSAITLSEEENAAVMRDMFLHLMDVHALILMNVWSIWIDVTEVDAKTYLEVSDVTASMDLFLPTI